MLLFPITPEDHAWAERTYPSLCLYLGRVFQHESDKGGAPYFNHLLTVANAQHDWARKVIALCHDLLEFNPNAGQNLIDSGMPESILSRVRLLTRDPKDTYMEYIELVSHDYVATEIKFADLKHNMQVDRFAEFGDREISLLKRYHKALTFLREVYPNVR